MAEWGGTFLPLFKDFFDKYLRIWGTHPPLRNAWSLFILVTKQQERKKFKRPTPPGLVEKGACYMWLSGCTVTPAAICQLLFWDTLTIFGVPLTTAFVWQVWQLRSRLEVALFPWLCSQSQAAGAGSAQVGTTQTILFRINLDLQSKPAGAHDHNLGLDRMCPKMKIFFFNFFALQHI